MFWPPAWRQNSGRSHRHNNNTCRNLLAAWNRNRMVAIDNNHLWNIDRSWGSIQIWPQILDALLFYPQTHAKDSRLLPNVYFLGWFGFCHNLCESFNMGRMVVLFQIKKAYTRNQIVFLELFVYAGKRRSRDHMRTIPKMNKTNWIIDFSMLSSFCISGINSEAAR